MPLTQFSTPLAALHVVVVDTETTGLDASKARVVQFAAIPVAGEAIDLERGFDMLLNPGIPIPPKTSLVHGIHDADVAAAPRFAAAVPRIEAAIGTAIVVGHTIGYDLAILKREYQLAGLVWHQPRALDIRHLARLVQPSLAAYDLDRLCEWLDIEIKGRHTAMGDAVATARVYIALIPMLRSHNIRTLAEADAASRRLAESEAQASGGLNQSAPTTAAAGATAFSRIDSFPYRHRVREVMSSPVVYADADATIEAAVRELAGRRISSALVKVSSGEVGIVTEKDLLRVIGQQGGPALQLRMSDVASVPLQTVNEADFVYRAIGRMGRLGFRHLAVRNAQGEITGMVTAHRLLRQRATAALVLGDEIDRADGTPALAHAWAKLPSTAASLMAEDVDALTISNVVSAEIAGMTRRAAELAEARLIAEGHGPAPVPYAVMILGSGGRGESQLAADQDNAIVFASGAEGGAEDAYFEKLAALMNETLDTAGIPFCKGGVMAKNTQWRKSVAGWRATIDGWLRRNRPEDLLNVDIFFDALPVHGDAALVDAIWNYAFERAKGEPQFHVLMAETARKRRPAFTLFGGLRTDEKGRQDLKATGLMPIFSSSRVLAIKHDIRARSTPDRLAGLVTKGAASAEVVQTIVNAQKVILATVIGQQLIDTEAGVPLTTRVAIGRLGKAEKAGLKQALSDVEEAIGLVSEGRV